jgi:poly(A) polymerase
MVRHHLRPGQLSPKGELPTRRAVYRYYRDLGEAALDTLYLNLADYLAARGPDLEMEDWRSRCQAIAMVLAAPEETAARLPLRLLEGHDLMETFHLQPGPLIGRLLEVVREAQAVGEVTTREEALALARGVLDEMVRGETPVPGTGREQKEHGEAEE